MAKTKQILVIHANSDYNCGDQLIYLGAKHLITEALGGSQNIDFKQFDIYRAEHNPITYPSFYPWGDIDIIALAGSPWIWDQCLKSPKYQVLTNVLKRYPKIKKIALGLGSCFTWEQYESMINNPLLSLQQVLNISDDSCIQLIDLYKQFDYITVRDHFCKLFFDKLGIESYDRFDTSIYAYPHFSPLKSVRTDKKILWFIDPSQGLSHSNLPFKNQDYIDYELNWAKENDADIYCNSYQSMLTLRKLGIQNSSFSVDLDFIYHKLSEYSEILSGRIHMAAMSFLASIPKITILPVDTRFLTVTKLGVDVHFIDKVFTYDQEETFPLWTNIKTQEQEIIDNLRTVLS